MRNFINLIPFLLFFAGISRINPAVTMTIMFYNVENAFDINDDPETEDNDFLPGGIMRWNQTRFNKKIRDIYKTIVAAGAWEPPDVVGFAEIENRKVLEDLVFGSFLSKYNYRIIHEDSPDRRGIDVCLIYRKDRVRIVDYEYLVPETASGSGFHSRSVLHAAISAEDDTLHIFVCHWPSRKGGVLAGEDLRQQLSVMIRKKAESLSKSRIIIMGDFNSTPEDDEIHQITADGSLVNLSDSRSFSGMGTYRYQGIWEMIDQVIVSSSFFSEKKGWSADPGSLTIFRPDFLLSKDPVYPGMSPFSTYRGYRYQGGISDHLPLVLRLHLLKD